MLLAELLKDDVKDSLYAKTKDYYVGDELFSPPFRIRKLEVDRFCIVDNAGKIIPNSVTKSLYAASEKLKDIKFKFTPRQNQDSCKVGDARQIIFRYKFDGNIKTIKMPVREILRYSNKNASEAATNYLRENFPEAKLIDVGTSDSCRVGDDEEQIQYKGYLISKLKDGNKYFVFKNNNPVVFSNSISNYFDTVEIAKKKIDESEKKIIGDSHSQFCRVGDVAFGGKGYKCAKCHATADSVHKIVHVKDDGMSKEDKDRVESYKRRFPSDKRSNIEILEDLNESGEGN